MLFYREPDIPSDASITYEIELLNVIGVPNFKSMSITETIKFSDQKRQRGNFLYSRGEHSAAIASYTKYVSHSFPGFTKHCLQGRLKMVHITMNNKEITVA